MEGSGFIYRLHRPRRGTIQCIVSVAILQSTEIHEMKARAMRLLLRQGLTHLLLGEGHSPQAASISILRMKGAYCLCSEVRMPPLSCILSHLYQDQDTRQRLLDAHQSSASVTSLTHMQSLSPTEEPPPSSPCLPQESLLSFLLPSGPHATICDYPGPSAPLSCLWRLPPSLSAWLQPRDLWGLDVHSPFPSLRSLKRPLQPRGGLVPISSAGPIITDCLPKGQDPEENKSPFLERDPS